MAPKASPIGWLGRRPFHFNKSLLGRSDGAEGVAYWMFGRRPFHCDKSLLGRSDGAKGPAQIRGPEDLKI